MPHKCLLISFLLLFCSVVSAQEESGNPFTFKWENGFKLNSQDNQFSLKFGGRIMVDHAYLFQSSELNESFGPLTSKSGTEIRRARLYFSGDIYKNTFFKFQVDFAGDQVSLKDVYIGFKNIPIVGKVTVGHFKEPLRLSAINSSKYTTFLEPAQNIDFAQVRNNGILLSNDFLNRRLSAQFGAFRNADNNSNDVFADDGYVIGGRVTGLVINEEEKNHLLHLGAAYSYRNPKSKEYSVSVRPGVHLAPKYLATGPIENLDYVGLTNFESAYVHGAFSFQGEYLTASVNTYSRTYKFSNYYGEFSYFLTGESKKFKGSYAGFDGVTPNKNFGGNGKGAGAWEVALRYSETDLTDKSVLGGNQKDIALALNWYPNPVTRLMLNYVWADVESKGQGNYLQGRLQIEF